MGGQFLAKIKGRGFKEVEKSDRSNHYRFLWDGREFIWEPSRRLPALLLGRQAEWVQVEGKQAAAGFLLRRWLLLRLRGGRESGRGLRCGESIRPWPER
jgi:hypothetical protein